MWHGRGGHMHSTLAGGLTPGGRSFRGAAESHVMAAAQPAPLGRPGRLHAVGWVGRLVAPTAWALLKRRQFRRRAHVHSYRSACVVGGMQSQPGIRPPLPASRWASRTPTNHAPPSLEMPSLEVPSLEVPSLEVPSMPARQAIAVRGLPYLTDSGRIGFFEWTSLCLGTSTCSNHNNIHCTYITTTFALPSPSAACFQP